MEMPAARPDKFKKKKKKKFVFQFCFVVSFHLRFKDG